VALNQSVQASVPAGALATLSGQGGHLVGTDELGRVVITPTAELDLASAPGLLDLIRKVIALSPPRIVLNLSTVTFVDSSGCNALAIGWREARAADVRFCLRDEMTRSVRRIMAVTLLLPMFDPA
jgi:anti-anti-sigma factor